MEVQAGNVGPNVVIEGEQAAFGVPDDLIALMTESALNPPDLADAPETNVVYLPIVMR